MMMHMRQVSQHRKKELITLLAIVLLAGYTYWAITRPLPQLKPSEGELTYSVRTGQPLLQWPAKGQSAAAILGTDILETNGSQKPVPTASTAKVITALVVLQKKPLQPGQQGPTITLTDKDAAIYYQYVAKEGSVVPINVGEEISEYQMLQAIMLPSANNIADSLAIWAFGSLSKYEAYANLYLKQHGLASTHVGSDASGLAPDTTSTAADLARLGELAMQQPVLSQIVGQSTANIPVAGTVENVNSLVSKNGLVGVKTGNSDQAGGVFIGAARQNINGHLTTTVTAVAGAPDLAAAMGGTLPLMSSVPTNFKPVTVMKADTIVSHYTVPWAGTIPIYVGSNLVANVWNGRTVPLATNVRPLPADSKSLVVGTLNVTDSAVGNQSVPLVIKHAIPEPSAWWRLTHPIR
jgi:D-alanyl-D-alanine carboxypeptidase (penicillin-binding protein 5/6)